MRYVVDILVGLALAVLASIGFAVFRWRRASRSTRGRDLGLAGGQPGFDLVVTDRLGLTTKMIKALSGNAHLIIEGEHLKDGDLSGIEGVTDQVPPPLRRHTAWSIPKEDLLVLPLEAGSTEAVSSLLPSLNWDAISHVQVEKDGQLMFGAYDWFEFAWIPESLGEEFLSELIRERVISGYDRSPHWTSLNEFGWGIGSPWLPKPLRTVIELPEWTKTIVIGSPVPPQDQRANLMKAFRASILGTNFASIRLYEPYRRRVKVVGEGREVLEEFLQAQSADETDWGMVGMYLHLIEKEDGIHLLLYHDPDGTDLELDMWGNGSWGLLRALERASNQVLRFEA